MPASFHNGDPVDEIRAALRFLLGRFWDRPADPVKVVVPVKEGSLRRQLVNGGQDNDLRANQVVPVKTLHLGTDQPNP